MAGNPLNIILYIKKKKMQVMWEDFQAGEDAFTHEIV